MEKNKEAKEVDPSTGSVGKLLSQLTLSAITAQIINVPHNMVDRIHIGRLPGEGAHMLTDVGIIFPVITTIPVFAALVSMGGTSRVPIMLGRGRKEETEDILGNHTTALITAAVVLTAFFLIFGRSILLMSGASGNTIEYGWAYMQIYPLGTIFVQLALGFNAFIDAQRYTKIGVYTMLTGTTCNITPDPILMFMFRMDVWGAALATIISQGISVIWVILFLISNKSYLKVRARYMRPKREILMPAIALGAAPFVMQLTGNILNICSNTSLLKYGGDVVAGAIIVIENVVQFFLLLLQGLTRGARPTISFNYDVKKLGHVSRTFRLLLISCLTYSIALWAMAMFALVVYIHTSTHNAALIDSSEWSTRIYTAASLLFGVQLACQQTFIVIGDGRTPLFLALLRKVILLIPLVYTLPNIFENKVFAVFVAEPIAGTITVCTTITLFILIFWRMKWKLGAHA